MLTPFEEGLSSIYSGSRVVVTGHTGFKGSWLTLWLTRLGARVTGFAQPPETNPSLFNACGLRSRIDHVEGDVRDRASVEAVLSDASPDFIFHLAAQALVRRSYAEPVETIATNVMGTAHLLDALARLHQRAAVVIVTSDKCYANRADGRPHTESDPLGGADVYSASKAATEIVAASFRESFFHPMDLDVHGVAIATARAGNVIGGGDWSADRLIPDLVRAFEAGVPAQLRFPEAIRPWQHVLEPLGGYLLLAAGLAGRGQHPAARYCEAWNFGPADADMATVAAVSELFARSWGGGTYTTLASGEVVRETAVLRLAADKARQRLGWSATWGLSEAVSQTARWYRAHSKACGTDDVYRLCEEQIQQYASQMAGMPTA